MFQKKEKNVPAQTCFPFSLQVVKKNARSALIQWTQPEDENDKLQNYEIDPMTDYKYKLFLSDRGKEGKYRVVYQ